MSKATDLLEKLEQRKEAIAVVEAYWEELFPEFGSLQRTQVQAWLTLYDLETVVAGLESTSLKVNKVNQAAEEGRCVEMTPLRVVKYASTCMRNAGLTDEERQALEDKKEKIKAARSAAGKKGNEKRWHQDATVCDDLRSDATNCNVLPKCTGSGSVTGSGLGTGTSTGEPDPATPGLPSTPEGLEAKPENPEPTPSAVSGVVPNKNRKTKTAPDGVPYPDGFNDWSNKKRLDWLQEHQASSPKAEAAVAAATGSTAPACSCPEGKHRNSCMVGFNQKFGGASLVGKVAEL